MTLQIVRLHVLVLMLFVGSVMTGCVQSKPGQVLAEHESTQAILADDIAGAEEALEAARSALLGSTDMPAAVYANRLIDLGLWQEAEKFFQVAEKTIETQLAEGRLYFKTHQYGRAQAVVNKLLATDSDLTAARILNAHLQIQAWNLEGATKTLQPVMQHGFNVEAALVMGRIRLLERNYESAMDWAHQIQAHDPENADAFLLEADVFFWQRDLASAEPALQRALDLNPFNAEARFAYGYAIWRRVDATLLDQMAGHWNLGLALDPLNYRIHWHIGNGHTNLTYADYAHPSDSTVRAELQIADSLLASDEVDKAIAYTRSVEQAYPGSVLPAMMRASAFFMAYNMDRESRLDSAQFHFLRVLDKKKNYGPAHNGVAAVIKHRQFSQLKDFGALDQAIEEVEIPNAAEFASVFPGARYYPGDRMEQMLYHQLHKGIVYLPFLVRLQRTFKIPPLHVDLAEAMDAPFFRFATTFDNRQWMDIRGVGSGAAGIEYVERGAYLERNVVLHEYVHLFHGQILTDEENRRIRALYLAAMQEDRTLDYYSANNESEYLAQTYTAYFAPVKVHPLNHKAMNTRQDLEEQDPELFQFIDDLVTRQSAYLRGDTLALASNWAQTYVSLSEQARDGRGPDAVPDSAAWFSVSAALLDTALTWDAKYLPAHLSYASLLQEQEDFDEAARWLDRAQDIDAGYAPLYRGRAALANARFEAGMLSVDEAFAQQKTWYEESLDREKDFATRASLNAALRNLYLQFGEVDAAIEVADRYVETAPIVSTYLRDRRDEAWVFASTHRSNTGYAEAVVDEFGNLISRKPQQYTFRKHYADVLAAVGRYQDAIEVLEESQRILSAAGRPRKDYMVRLADLYLQVGDTMQVREVMSPLLDDHSLTEMDECKLIRVLASLGELDQASMRFGALDTYSIPMLKAERAFTEGVLFAAKGDHTAAINSWRTAIEENAHHMGAHLRLVEGYIELGQTDNAKEVASKANKLGPAFDKRLASLFPGIN